MGPQDVVLERRDAIAAPFPDAWRDILYARVPFYEALTDGDCERFEAKRGLPEVTEEMKVVIAATACRLTMNMPGEEYGRLRHIIVTDRAFRDPDDEYGELIGWAMHGGVKVSWPHVLEGLADPADGVNVG
jgi:Mlc titration factor MtfA (ptsG expression regulator)